MQVYPKGWSVIYAYLDNPGMWNLRSQTLKNWYLGQEIYIRVYDPDPNPAKEMPPPQNLLYCGLYHSFILTETTHNLFYFHGFNIIKGLMIWLSLGVNKDPSQIKVHLVGLGHASGSDGPEHLTGWV